MLPEIVRIRNRRTARTSSYDLTGRNDDWWTIPPGESRVLADLKGPGLITHLWMTQSRHYRECLLRITWDDAPHPSVEVPLGDFFCLGHGIVNSFQSLYFNASTQHNHTFNQGCALNCYLAMPFRKRARVELHNESGEKHSQFFYVDHETLDEKELGPDVGYLHAEFRRRNPFGGWGPEILVNQPQSRVVNKEQQAFRDNYVILETEGRGHYVGCNLSITNLQGTWWGEGDDMIWVDGYKWPPDLHGTGSEDYFGQAWGMQDNAFLRNGSSIFEGHTMHARDFPTWNEWFRKGGYQTSYVFHVENPVRFTKSIKVTIEHGHGNHLRNEVSSVAYWYAERPSPVAAPPPLLQRLPIRRDAEGNWLSDPERWTPAADVPLSDEMRAAKEGWKSERGQPG